MLGDKGRNSNPQTKGEILIHKHTKYKNVFLRIPHTGGSPLTGFTNKARLSMNQFGSAKG